MYTYIPLAPLAARPFKIKGFADKPRVRQNLSKTSGFLWKPRVLAQILQFKTTDEHQDDGNNQNPHEWPVAEENWVEEGFLCGKKRLQLKPVLNPYWAHILPVLTHMSSIETSGLCRNLGFSKPVLNPY